ncbi:hypothetical protein CRG98_021468 [Punica granatum]|uniref:Uncharacterized protein n=1 Tax=Punica granatum TaxID=22663 RepID=A0A2I0JPB2_PUNGR|nr:hypothetical protein CRG98_021468 [Punica granatum]
MYRSCRRALCFGQNGLLVGPGWRSIYGGVLRIRERGFLGVSLVFLMCSETTVISICQKRVLKACWEAFVTIKTSLGRSKRASFPESGSTWETKMNSETKSESYSMVLVVLGCVQACFRVLFICLWIGRLGSPVRKASANVREYPGLSRSLLKCAQRCHWSFWYQEGFLKSHIGYLLTLR